MTTSQQGRASRRRGASFERGVVGFLTRLGIPAERTSNGRAQAGHGDVDGIPDLHIEVKNQARLDLAGWVDQARRDAAGTGRLPVVIIKRRGVSEPAASYVVCELGPFLAHLGITEPDPTAPHEGKPAVTEPVHTIDVETTTGWVRLAVTSGQAFTIARQLSDAGSRCSPPPTFLLDLSPSTDGESTPTKGTHTP